MAYGDDFGSMLIMVYGGIVNCMVGLFWMVYIRYWFGMGLRRVCGRRVLADSAIQGCRVVWFEWFTGDGS